MITMILVVWRLNVNLVFLLFSPDFVQNYICTLFPCQYACDSSDGTDPLRWCRQIILVRRVQTKPWIDENTLQRLRAVYRGKIDCIK